MKTKVKILHTIAGRDDDARGVVNYIEGEEYEIGQELLRLFIDQGAVALVGAATRETKVLGPLETKPFKKGKHK